MMTKCFTSKKIPKDTRNNENYFVSRLQAKVLESSQTWPGVPSTNALAGKFYASIIYVEIPRKFVCLNIQRDVSAFSAPK